MRLLLRVLFRIENWCLRTLVGDRRADRIWCAVGIHTVAHDKDYFCRDCGHRFKLAPHSPRAGRRS